MVRSRKRHVRIANEDLLLKHVVERKLCTKQRLSDIMLVRFPILRSIGTRLRPWCSVDAARAMDGPAVMVCAPIHAPDSFALPPPEYLRPP